MYEKVGFGTFGAAGKVRWLDAEGFDIRWLGERTFASTANEAETQRKLSGNPINWDNKLPSACFESLN